MTLNHHLLMQHYIFLDNLLRESRLKVLVKEEIAVLDHVYLGMVVVTTLWDVLFFDVE